MRSLYATKAILRCHKQGHLILANNPVEGRQALGLWSKMDNAVVALSLLHSDNLRNKELYPYFEKIHYQTVKRQQQGGQQQQQGGQRQQQRCPRWTDEQNLKCHIHVLGKYISKHFVVVVSTSVCWISNTWILPSTKTSAT